MKTNNEKIEQHIEELQQLVKGTKAGLIVAYTSPEKMNRRKSCRSVVQ